MTGCHANDGVRVKVSRHGSFARRRKPWSFCGAASVVEDAERVAAPAPDASRRASTKMAAGRARNIGSPPVSALLRRYLSLECRSGSQNERIRPRTPDQLDGCGQPVLGGTAGERESGPAQGVERIREPRDRDADRIVRRFLVRRRDESLRRRDQEVESLEQLRGLVAEGIADTLRLGE